MKVGIDLGGTNMRIGLVDKGVLLHKECINCPAHASQQEVMRCLEQLIEKNLNHEVSGIGIGVPSVVDAENGIVYNVANITSWKRVELKKELEEKFKIPVFVNNDSNCFTLGVAKYEMNHFEGDLVGVTMGTGIGTGIIVNGNLYTGRNTGAGEIGSVKYLDLDFEHYCSSDFFVRKYHISGKEAGCRARNGEPEALKIWEEFGKHVGELMKAILYTYDPQKIVIGGGISSAFSLFEESMKRNMADFPYLQTLNNVEISVCKNEDIALLGASALVK